MLLLPGVDLWSQVFNLSLGSNADCRCLLTPRLSLALVSASTSSDLVDWRSSNVLR